MKNVMIVPLCACYTIVMLVVTTLVSGRDTTPTTHTGTTTSQGIDHVCGNAESMIDPWVLANFNVKNMEGTFYELAYHDYTQPRKVCSCERSQKTVNVSSVPVSINDLFSLKCGTRNQITHLLFNNTDKPGVLHGQCDFFPTGVCPDYVIDVGTRNPEELYPWALEFQCVENPDGSLLFAGVNFYSTIKSDEILNIMMKSAYDHGLGPFMDGGNPAGLWIVDHTGCTYPSLI